MTTGFSKIKAARQRVAVDLADLELVAKEQMIEGREMPLIVTPIVRDIELADWVADHRDEVDALFAKHGAILFRGFSVPSTESFERVAQAVVPELFGDYGDLPPEATGTKVYHSTPYPADKAILFHNESSHLPRFPARQFFHCVIPSEEGGETPIVDCRHIYNVLPREIVEPLEEKGLMYVRNFTDGLDVNWREFYRTDDKAEVEKFCRMTDTDFQWTENGLRTSQVRPAVITYPATGEKVFFNQIQLHHVSRLDPEVRDALSSLFSPDDMPRNVFYGDGTPIPDEVVDEITDTYWRESVAYRWQAGDILMVDNLIVAHARNPFKGKRKIVVAMGDMRTMADL
jgi:alpha-ketoglutarate-dependent taurine dioxygenase